MIQGIQQTLLKLSREPTHNKSGIGIPLKAQLLITTRLTLATNQVTRKKKKRKMIPSAEWLKLTTEQKDATIAQNKQKPYVSSVIR